MKVKFNVKRYFQVLGITLGIMLVGAFVCLGLNYSGINEEEVVDSTAVEVDEEETVYEDAAEIAEKTEKQRCAVFS